MRTLVETGALEGERGAYRLTRPVETLQVPATVQTVLSARIDRLPPEEKRLLQAASVIGKHVPYSILAAITEQPEDTLRRGLAHLQESEFIYETQLFPDHEFTFKHALTHEVAYAGLLGERRRALHAAVVTALEHLYGDRLDEHIERLAHHALRGELWDKACAYSHDAGRKSLARSAYREALTHLEQALAIIPQQPEDTETLQRAFGVRLALRNALLPLGMGARAVELTREAEALARRLGDHPGLVRVTRLMLHGFWVTGRTDEARRYGEMALELAEAHGDASAKIIAHSLVGQSEVWWGDWVNAERHLDRAIALLRTNDLRPGEWYSGIHPGVQALSNLGWIHAHRGDFATGLRLGEEAVQIAESLRYPHSAAYSIVHLAAQHLHRGALSHAMLQCERGVDVGGEAAAGFFSPYFDAFRAYVQVLSGSIDLGLPVLRRAVDAQTSMGFRYGLGWLRALLGEGLLLAGRHGEAAEEASRALALARDCGERAFEANAHRLLAAIAAQTDPTGAEGAEDHYQCALTIASQLGARPLVAHCHLGLGKLYRRTGKRQEAKEHLTTATAMYREMDMWFYLEQAEAAMREVM